MPFYIFAAPGVALIWQRGDFELGLGTRYVVAPIDSFQLTLMSGVRFYAPVRSQSSASRSSGTELVVSSDSSLDAEG